MLPTVNPRFNELSYKSDFRHIWHRRQVKKRGYSKSESPPPELSLQSIFSPADSVPFHIYQGPAVDCGSRRLLGIGVALAFAGAPFGTPLPAVYDPISLVGKKIWTKLELIRLCNGRRNRPPDEEPYPETSLGSKKLSRSISDLARRLLEAEQRH